MAIGAEDYIDQLLVQKYAQEKVDNHDSTPSMVDPEKMMGAMSDFASMSRNMFTLNQKLSQACSALNAANVKYKRATMLKYDEYYGEYYETTEEQEEAAAAQAQAQYAEQNGEYQEEYQEQGEYQEEEQYAEAAA